MVKLDAGNNKKYELETIWDIEIYTKELESYFPLTLCYSVLWKSYREKENILEPILIV